MRLLDSIAPPLAMLHSVSDSLTIPKTDWCIPHRSFSQLLDVLEDQGCQTTHFAEWVQPAFRSSCSRPVILCFDDCPKHLLDFAVPELLRRNMKAAFYMPTAYIGSYNEWDAKKGYARMELMNESDLRELLRVGMEVGSHSHCHMAMTGLSLSKQREEAERSKQLLEAIIGNNVYSFAYPYGAVPAGYEALLSNAGYYYGVSIYQAFETAFALRRFGVYEKDTPLTLTRKLSRRYRLMRSLYDVIKKK